MKNKSENLLTNGEKIVDLNGNEHIIEKRIGGGGQGDIYSTKDPSIALKINKKDEIDNLDDIKNFKPIVIPNKENKILDRIVFFKSMLK